MMRGMGEGNFLKKVPFSHPPRPLLSSLKDFRVYRIPVLRFYGMLPSVRCIIFLKRQCEDCLFNMFKLVSYILDILFPAGMNSSRRASPSSISLRALHNGVKRGDGEGAAAAPSFKDDLGNVALGKEFL